MLKSRTLLIACLVVCLGLLAVSLLVGHSATAEAQETASAFAQVQIVTYASGVTGFFDRSTGRLYLYDSNLRNCVAIRQVTALGEAAEVIK